MSQYVFKAYLWGWMDFGIFDKFLKGLEKVDEISVIFLYCILGTNAGTYFFLYLYSIY